MQGLNQVILNGNLCAEPEFKTISSGQSMVKLRVATSENFKDRNDEWQERVEYHSVVVWGRQADSLLGKVVKGARVLVIGSLTTRSYEKEGEKRYSTEVRAQKVIPQVKAGGSAPRAEERYAADEDDGDCIPF